MCPILHPAHLLDAAAAATDRAPVSTTLWPFFVSDVLPMLSIVKSVNQS